MIVMKNIFLKFKFNILKNYITFTMIYPCCLKELKLKTLKKDNMIKEIYVIQNKGEG